MPLGELKFDSVLGPEEADAKFTEFVHALEDIQRNPYSGRWSLINRLLNRLSSQNGMVINECYAALCPLLVQDVVRLGQTEDATQENILDTILGASIFESRFSNRKHIEVRAYLIPQGL